MAPTTAVAVTAWPARPLLIERSFAIGVRIEAGRNSAVTRAKTPSESETTAGQAAVAVSAAASADAAVESDMENLRGCFGAED